VEKLCSCHRGYGAVFSVILMKLYLHYHKYEPTTWIQTQIKVLNKIIYSLPSFYSLQCFFLGCITFNHCLSHFLFLLSSFSSLLIFVYYSSLLFPPLPNNSRAILLYYVCCISVRCHTVWSFFFWYILPLLLMIICKIIIYMILYTDKC
jgi:hypothetical protein